MWAQALAAQPWVCTVLSHQEVNLSSHFHVVDPPACFIALPLAAAARLLIVASSLYDVNKPVGGEDSVQGPVGTFHVPLLNHHSPGNELQMFSHDLEFKSSFFRTYRLDKEHGNQRPNMREQSPSESRVTTGGGFTQSRIRASSGTVELGRRNSKYLRKYK